MSWVVFSVGAWLMLGAEIGLKGSLRLGGGSIAPSFLAVYAVFVACYAPPRVAQWACIIIGLLMDLSSPVVGAADFTAAGPNALGALLMCQLVLALRGLMFRRNPLSMAFLACVGFALWQLLYTAVFSVRHLAFGHAAWNPSAELWSRLGSSVYTGVLAIPLSLLLILLMPAFDFQHATFRFQHKR